LGITGQENDALSSKRQLAGRTRERAVNTCLENPENSFNIWFSSNNKLFTFISLHISEAAIQEQIAASEEIDGVRKEKERLTAASLKKNRNLQRKGKRFLKEKDPENEWLINNIRNQQITVYNQE